MSVGPHLEKFNIVSNDHERTRKCDFCVSIGKINFTDHDKPDATNGFGDSVLNPQNSEILNIPGKGVEPYVVGLDDHLETTLYYLTLISLWVAIYTFPILKDVKYHI